MDPLATALAGGNGGYEGHLAAASLLKGGPHAASSKLAQDAALVETAIALVANRTHHHRRWCVDDGHALRVSEDLRCRGTVLVSSSERRQ